MTIHFYSPTFSYFLPVILLLMFIKRFFIKNILAKKYSFYAKKYYFLVLLAV